MLSTAFLVVALSLVSFSHTSVLATAPPSQYGSTCHRIACAISNSSRVFYPNSSQYNTDNEHVVISSSQVSACSVELGSAADASVILRILGTTRTPFAVKGGGHTFNPGFSSTSGVQISMTRFNSVELNHDTGTVDAGSGVTWDHAYAALESSGLNIVGGRIPTVGVSGLTLGGGYAFISKYGLTIDNMAGYELVLPNGTITNGGIRNYTVDQLGLVKEALVKFQQKNDTKAALNVATSYTPGGYVFRVNILLYQLGIILFKVIPIAIVFYNAPTPRQGFSMTFFWRFRLISSDVKTRSLVDLVNNLALYPPPTARCHHRDPTLWPVMKHSAYLSGISVTQYSPSVFDTIVNPNFALGRKLGGLDPNVAVTFNFEPFLSDVFSHGSDSAYPPDRSQAVRNYSDAVIAAAVADGQDVSHASVYPNYAFFDTPLEDLYGANLPRLRAIQDAVDPENVMGLAGGFKLRK
ncbi:FAD dependent oxidoreductase [Lactarius pseudohatsudake]|nr:FAD dependent oxidoreductase [Lactarius pseudohatsudake]